MQICSTGTNKAYGLTYINVSTGGEAFFERYANERNVAVDGILYRLTTNVLDKQDENDDKALASLHDVTDNDLSEEPILDVQRPNSVTHQLHQTCTSPPQSDPSEKLPGNEIGRAHV